MVANLCNSVLCSWFSTFSFWTEIKGRSQIKISIIKMINIIEIQYLSSVIGRGKYWTTGEKTQTKDIMEREGKQKLGSEK